MIAKLHLVLVLLFFALVGCYSGITGIVVDAETQKPIEGAVFLVEWTKTHGIGDHWTESYKVIETISDEAGKVKIEGCYSPFVDPPNVTVYKQGYVAWNSQIIFPGSRVRGNFKWIDSIYKLERFSPEYSHNEHAMFIEKSIHINLGVRNKGQIIDAFRWEREKASDERRMRRGGS